MLLLFTIMNKGNFINGIKKIALAISFAFVGPYLIHQAFQNKNHEFYLYVLSLGIIIAAISIILGFLGISNLVKSLLSDDKK